MANILRSQGKLDEAIDQYRQVIQVSPGLVEARAGLARALASLARYDQAIEQYREVLEQKPDYLPALNALAWILATRPDTGSRRPDRAIALAERACRLTGYRNPTLLNTLAAAYASAGRFDRAADTAESALERASAGENRDLEEDIRKRLERYRGGEL
jgi:tetratricopeptide (TPR) repeat protein